MCNPTKLENIIKFVLKHDACRWKYIVGEPGCTFISSLLYRVDLCSRRNEPASNNGNVYARLAVQESNLARPCKRERHGRRTNGPGARARARISKNSLITSGPAVIGFKTVTGAQENDDELHLSSARRWKFCHPKVVSPRGGRTIDDVRNKVSSPDKPEEPRGIEY